MTGGNRSAAAGEWVEPEVSYVNPSRRFCGLCGRPIARRYWRVVREGEERIYCEVRHAELDAARPMTTSAISAPAAGD